MQLVNYLRLNGIKKGKMSLSSILRKFGLDLKLLDGIRASLHISQTTTMQTKMTTNIKECQDSKRLGLIQFLNLAENNLISDWSKRRSVTSYSHIAFHSEPQLKLGDWTNAWQWCSLNKQIIRYKQDGRDLYYMPSGLESKLSALTVKEYFNIVNEMSWKCFDSYVDQVREITYVKFNKKNWKNSFCSCVYWAKNYYCHHVIGVAVMKKKAHFLDVHMEIPIGQTRGRGQPKKTASALETQDDGLELSEDSSQDDDEEDPSPLEKNL